MGRKPQDGINVEFMLERKVQLPLNAPARLVEDIERYNALVEMQAKMMGASAWYQQLN